MYVATRNDPDSAALICFSPATPDHGSCLHPSLQYLLRVATWELVDGRDGVCCLCTVRVWLHPHGVPALQLTATCNIWLTPGNETLPVQLLPDSSLDPELPMFPLNYRPKSPKCDATCQASHGAITGACVAKLSAGYGRTVLQQPGRQPTVESCVGDRVAEVAGGRHCRAATEETAKASGRPGAASLFAGVR